MDAFLLDTNIMHTVEYRYDGSRLTCNHTYKLEHVVGAKNVVAIQKYHYSLWNDRLFPFRIGESFNVLLDHHSAKDKSSRFIGRPVCIACHKNLLLVQCVTSSSRFVSFFVIDAVSKRVLHWFQDPLQYIDRSFISAGLIEGALGTDTQNNVYSLIRLPQKLLSSHRWSRMFRFYIQQSEEAAAEVDCELQRDRRFQDVLFDRFDPSRIYSCITDTDKHKILLQVSTGQGKSCQTSTHRYKSRDQQQALLHQSKACLTRTNDMFIICNLYILRTDDADDDATLMCRCFFFDSDTLELVREYQQDLNANQLTVSLRDLIACYNVMPMITLCDRFVQVWALRPGQADGIVLLTLTVPHRSSLQALTRAVIVDNMSESRIQHLGLPRKLHNYLLFL